MRRRQPVRRRAVAVRRPEDHARERELNQRRRVVARLQQSGQPLLAQSIEVAGRETSAAASTSAINGSASASFATGTDIRIAE